MKKVLVILITTLLLVVACTSPTDDEDKYFEPVEDKYKIIEVPIINDID